MLLFEERQGEGQLAWGHPAARFGQVHSLKTIKELSFSYSKNMENMQTVGVMFTICIETMQIFEDMTRTVFVLVKKNSVPTALLHENLVTKCNKAVKRFCMQVFALFYLQNLKGWGRQIKSYLMVFHIRNTALIINI